MQDKKDFNKYKWIKGETPGINTNKKKNPTGGMDVCVVFIV
jgi:hypothetical protein